MINDDFPADLPATSAGEGETLRIGIVIQHFPPQLGGAERQAELLASELARRGNTVRVITTRHQRELPAHENTKQVTIWRLPTVSPRWLKLPLNLVTGFYAGLKVAWQLDVVHAHCLSPFVLGALLAARLARRPVLIKICSTGEHGDISRIRGFGPATSLWPLYRLADLFIAPTHAVARELLSEGCRPGQVAVVPNLLQDQAAPETAEGKRRLRQKLGLPEKTTLVYVGRLHQGKGVWDILSAWPVIRERYDAQLVLVGDGPERQGISQWRRESDIADSVTLAGYQADPDPYYRAADIFVFPSQSESFGNAIVEAMSHGLAVATTPVGVVEDWQEDAPVLRLDTSHAASFSALVGELIEDEKRRSHLGCAAAEFIQGHYGVSAICNDYLDHYHRLINARH